MSCCRPAAIFAALFVGCWLGVADRAPSAEPLRLTHDGRLKRDLRFRRAGKELIYVLEDSPIMISLMRFDLAKQQSTRFFPQAATSQFEPSFSADDQWLAFVELRGVTNVKLMIRNLRDNRSAMFDPGSDRAHLGNPSFSPDGQRIVFSLPAAGGQQIVSIDTQGSDRRDLTQGVALNDWAAFSPDGREIAFGSNRDGNFEIYAMRADGTQVRRLTDNPAFDFRPTWSPDGRQLAFTSNRDGNYEIYTMDSNGSRLARLTENPERDDFAAWDFAGRQVAVVSERQGEFDIYLYDSSP